MSYLTTTCPLPGGGSIEIRTCQRPGEEWEDFKKRHKQEVQDVKNDQDFFPREGK